MSAIHPVQQNNLPVPPVLEEFDYEADLERLAKQGINDIRSAIILGSGWGKVVQQFTVLGEIAYDEIQCIGKPDAPGHAGKIILVEAFGGRTAIFIGRRHCYESVPMGSVVAPVILARGLGATRIMLTNAAGGLNPAFALGDLMIIEDHLNGLQRSPLSGRPVFLGMNPLYDEELSNDLARSATAVQVPCRRGVYVATLGPEYESPAESRKFRNWGADAIGMSTVPEAIMARYFGMTLVGASCITNVAGGTGLSGDEVVRVLNERCESFGLVLVDFIPKLNAP